MKIVYLYGPPSLDGMVKKSAANRRLAITFYLSFLPKQLHDAIDLTGSVSVFYCVIDRQKRKKKILVTDHALRTKFVPYRNNCFTFVVIAFQISVLFACR